MCSNVDFVSTEAWFAAQNTAVCVRRKRKGSGLCCLKEYSMNRLALVRLDVGQTDSRHVFFTESNNDVIIPSVTSSTDARHVIDVHVYTAPSVDRHSRDVIACRLATVRRNDKQMGEETWPFTLSPSNDDANKNFRPSNNTVSLYLRPRDTAAEPRDQGLYCFSIRIT